MFEILSIEMATDRLQSSISLLLSSVYKMIGKWYIYEREILMACYLWIGIKDEISAYCLLINQFQDFFTNEWQQK